MTKPRIAQRGPYEVEVAMGNSYAWCACGLSARQPFCDGAHKGGEFKPVIMDVTAGEAYKFCGCKNSANGALCDGAHKNL